MEEIQKESSVNHKLVTVQELEEKSTVLRKLGETLTELKSESCRTSTKHEKTGRRWDDLLTEAMIFYFCHPKPVKEDLMSFG